LTVYEQFAKLPTTYNIILTCYIYLTQKYPCMIKLPLEDLNDLYTKFTDKLKESQQTIYHNIHSQ